MGAIRKSDDDAAKHLVYAGVGGGYLSAVIAL